MRQNRKVKKGRDLATLLFMSVPRYDATLFQVGATALCDGETVEITGPYGPYQVVNENGEYGDAEGRFDYCYGYTIREEDGSETFAPAHKLQLCNGKPSHLMLVKGRRKYR